MGSTKPISSSIPQWMKTKMNDRYDIEEPFSPPSHDDNFFYIRYPKSAVQQPQQQQVEKSFRPISDLLEKDPGLSRHTAPCRQFIPQIKMNGNDLPGTSFTKPKKSQGTDDGFTGEAAACGQSVVHVAKQMIAGKYTVEDSSMAAETYDFSKRRGSKSLPASPLSTPDSSPRFGRKSNPNRFFTGAFSAADKPNQELKYPGGWILSGFLGQREQVGLSIPEEEQHKDELAVEASTASKADESSGLRRNKSTSVIGRLLKEDTVDGVKGVRPKPSELREMNFWSPTSM